MLAILGVLAAGANTVATLNSILSMYPPFVTGRARFTYNLTPNMLPDLSALAMMLWRGEIDDTTYYQQARETGFDEPIARAYQQSLRQLLPVRDYVALYRRGEINENQLSEGLRRNGFAAADINLILKATEYFPSPQDLITFAVREVYNDETRKAFGQDEDISDRFIAEAKKAGVTEEQARNYWAAHWQLPSVGQGFEMLQRHAITQSQLQMLLKAADVMPFWRDALLKISYNPLTRVDIRRMHAMGVLSVEQVQERYEAEGFSPEDAALMTQFTVSYNTKQEGSSSQGKIIEAYKKDIIDVTQATEMLRESNLSTEAIDLLLKTADFDKALTRADETKADLMARYIAGDISLDDARSTLLSLGVPSSYVSATISELGRKTSAKVKLPTKEDLLTWLEKGLIKEEDFKARMQALGYKQVDVLTYLAERMAEAEEPKLKYLANGVYQRWLKKGMIDVQTFTAILTAKGAREEDIGLLIEESTG